MAIKLIRSQYVAMPKTVGVVWQERGTLRICLWWWHIVIYHRAERGSWRRARGVLAQQPKPGDGDGDRE